MLVCAVLIRPSSAIFIFSSSNFVLSVSCSLSTRLWSAFVRSWISVVSSLLFSDWVSRFFSLFSVLVFRFSSETSNDFVNEMLAAQLDIFVTSDIDCPWSASLRDSASVVLFIVVTWLWSSVRRAAVAISADFENAFDFWMEFVLSAVEACTLAFISLILSAYVCNSFASRVEFSFTLDCSFSNFAIAFFCCCVRFASLSTEDFVPSCSCSTLFWFSSIFVLIDLKEVSRFAFWSASNFVELSRFSINSAVSCRIACSMRASVWFWWRSTLPVSAASCSTETAELIRRIVSSSGVDTIDCPVRRASSFSMFSSAELLGKKGSPDPLPRCRNW